MRGDDVKALQEKLIAAGYKVGPDGADGIFGNNTFRAVVALQEDRGLAATGIADPETIKALDAAPTADGKFRLPEIQNGSKGTAVVLLQAVLTLLCYPCGKADGIFGPATAAALNRFKEDQDMEADGKVDLDVWKKLMEVLMQ
jgi:peptidoglycan hydrolase-like protein with peptidoglycan-binding domain